MNLRIKTKHIMNFCTAIPILSFMWMLFGFNTNNADMINYERRFYNGTSEFAESGFNAFINICKYFGISSYQNFLIIVSLILMVIIFYCALKYTDNAFSILFLFFFYPFFLFCIEIRFSISFCIILIATLFLLKNDKFSLPIFTGLVLIASVIHSSSIIYLIFIFHKVKISRRKKLYIIIGLAAIAAVATYTPLAFKLAYWISGGSDKIISWFTRHGRFGMLVPIVEQSVSYIIFKYAISKKTKYGINTTINAEILYDLNILMFLLIPCYFINNTFFRLYRVILFVNTIFYSEIIYYKSYDTKWKITKLGLLNASQILCISFWEIFSRPDVWLPFIKENLLFSIISDFFRHLA